jgi:phosphoglycolate phosphatase
VIGVNGVDASGKTIFALELDNYLRSRGIHTAIIHADDFHNPRAVRIADSSPEGYINNAFDTAQMAALIRELKQGSKNISINLHDLDTDAYTNNRTFVVTGNTVIIVEGVLLYRPPLDALFDYRIFLEVSFDEVLRRARERDVPKYGEIFIQRYINRYIPAQKLYLDEYEPKERSQLVIDNNDFLKPKILRLENRANHR